MLVFVVAEVGLNWSSLNCGFRLAYCTYGLLVGETEVNGEKPAVVLLSPPNIPSELS
jgi:hypothetical protein